MKHDFFVLQSATGAGLALSRFLAAHPEIHLPARDRVDSFFRDVREHELLGLRSEGGRRRGFLLHDNIQVEPSVPARVAALMRPDATFIQLVRDPREVILATHRRYLLAEVTSRWAESLQRPAVPGAELGQLSVEQIIDRLLPRLHYHAQGQRFAPLFGNWYLLGAAGLWPDRVDETLRELYGWLDVDPGFQSSLHTKDFHGFATKMLHFSQQELVINGGRILVRLERTPHVPFTHAGFTRELCRVPSVRDRAEFKLEDTSLSLVMDEATWAQMPRLVRGVLTSPTLAEFVENEFVPRWLSQANAIHAEVEERRTRVLPGRQADRLHRELGMDLAALFGRAPHLESDWAWGAMAAV